MARISNLILFLAITSCRKQIFKFRFRYWSAFWPFFEKTSKMAIFLNTCGHAIAAILTIFVIFAIMARPIMAINSNILWSFLMFPQRLAKMQISSENEIKKYAFYMKLWPTKRFGLKLWPFPLYFKVILAEKWPLQRKHFPCEFRAHPYLFGIRRARGMGLDRVLIQNQTFNFFAPPP